MLILLMAVYSYYREFEHIENADISFKYNINNQICNNILS